jgi:MFS family permease
LILLGRLFGGISTSLLFSVFESWMISSHKKEKFQQDLLYQTFAWSTFLNGFVAILSGLIANAAVDHLGLVYPFFIAGLLMIVAFVMIFILWEENYGEETKQKMSRLPKNPKTKQTSVIRQIIDGTCN